MYACIKVVVSKETVMLRRWESITGDCLTGPSSELTKGLRLKCQPLNSLRWPISIINPVDNTKYISALFIEGDKSQLKTEKKLAVLSIFS